MSAKEAASFKDLVHAFEMISRVSSRNAKRDLLKSLVIQHKELRTLLEDVLRYVYHPFWNYWVRVEVSKFKYNFTSKKATAPALANQKYWLGFQKILDRLKSRKVTGDKARREVEKYLGSVPKRSAYWLAQVLNRKLELGYQLKSFQKFYPDLVPKHSPMLAATWDGSKELNYEVDIDPKLDGERAQIIFDEQGVGTIVSRNGKPKFNCEHIIDELTKQGFAGVVFDGELMGETWGSGGVSRSSKKKSEEKLIFYAFDILELKDWLRQKSTMFERDRREWLREEISPKLKHTKLVTWVRGKFSAAQLKAMAQEQIDRGLEGVLIKRCLGLYLFKRDEDWQKYKYHDTVDLKVVGALEGKYKNKGSLGSLIAVGKIGKIKIRTEVGQGFSDKDRKRFWKMHKKGTLKGLVIEVTHYGLTSKLRSRDNSKPSALRNAIYERVREDKMER